MNKILIVYYSQANGNTRRIAQMIQQVHGYDIFEIKTVKPYTGSYKEIVDRGRWEVNNKYEPEIYDVNIDLSRYSTIILGTPTWWYTMAPAMLTFIKSVGWTNKTIIPFQTHGGWPGHVIDDIKKLCKGAKFEKEKAIQFDSNGGNQLITSEKEIKEWIDQLV